MAFLIGYSCKSISSQTNYPKSILDSLSPSGAGLQALVDFIDFCDKDGDYLQFFGTENVRNMFFRSKKYGEVPIEVQDKALEQRGFLSASLLARASSFGLRHSRVRAIGLYVKKTRTKAFLPDLRTTFLSLQCKPLALTYFLSPMGKNSEKDENLESGVKASRGDTWRTNLKQAYAKFGKAPTFKLNSPVPVARQGHKSLKGTPRRSRCFMANMASFKRALMGLREPY
jgi:hypothetical protein